MEKAGKLIAEKPIVTLPVPYLPAGTFAACAKTFLVIALLFGGAARQGLWSDAVVQLASLPMLVWSLVRLFSIPVHRSMVWPLVILCAIIALPLLQLIPMPPRLWAVLPGRADFLTAYHLAELGDPWLPLSLDPQATTHSLFSLLPAVALFLSMLTLDVAEKRALVPVLLGVALTSVLVGLLQISGANLYFYAITNEGMAVGFFANGNHNGSFMACAIAFCAAWILRRRQSDATPLRAGLAAAMLIALIIGAGLVGSRAGLGLAAIVGVLSLAMLFRSASRGRPLGRLWMVGFAVAAVFLVLFGLAGWSKRSVQQRDLIDDLRWPVAAVTLQAARDYMPVGTGFGTFVPIYQMSAPRTHLQERYVNHAHDDWLEIALEGGAPALLCLAAFLIWYGFTSFRIWFHDRVRGLDVLYARAGSIAVLLLLLHSVVDYPLRSVGVMMLFALSCGFFLPAAEASERRVGVEDGLAEHPRTRVDRLRRARTRRGEAG